MNEKLKLKDVDVSSALDEFFENCKNGETITYELLFKILNYLQAELQHCETKILPNKEVAYNFGIDSLVANIIIQLNAIAEKRKTNGQA